MKTLSTFIVLAALLAASCKQKDKYELFAEDLCICMKPMAELQKKLMTLSESGDEAAMQALFEDASKADQEGQACMLKLEEKHGRIEGPEEEEKAMNALRKVCPDIVAMMEETAGPQMPEMPLEEREGEGSDSHEGHDH